MMKRKTPDPTLIILGKVGIGLKRTIGRDVGVLRNLADAVSRCCGSPYVDDHVDRSSVRTWHEQAVKVTTYQFFGGTRGYIFSSMATNEGVPIHVEFETYADGTNRSALRSLTDRTLWRSAEAIRSAAKALDERIFVTREVVETASLALCAQIVREHPSFQSGGPGSGEDTRFTHTCEGPFSRRRGRIGMIGSETAFDPPAFPEVLILERGRNGSLNLAPKSMEHVLRQEPDAVSSMRAVSLLQATVDAMSPTTKT